ncbi:MAG: fused MFS/spermidine synthase [Atopobiaceae bacterium]|jgi:spermidine synthase|nr:fused MFS/spermidine synthase [Atopobiaceae bacterium]MCI2173896.1 fused MFS/spermidine synthase [Atopobiaceae bacterium]MCI2208014.1 fused MFS/spermidine synthase [Atopobiaceae bacterium]
MRLIIVTCVITVALILFVRVALPRLLEWRGVHLEGRTKFGPALVFDSADADGTAVRLLYVGGTFQSVCYLDDDIWSELVCSYHRTFAEVLSAAGGVGRACVIGGGGYSLPKYLITHDDHMHVDVVEIDPAVTELARRYFLLDRLEGGWDSVHRLGLVTDDGWEWLKRSDEPYDLVVNDAFKGRRPLGAMGCEEGAAIIHDHLTEGGIYLANVRARLEGADRDRLDDTAEAFSHAFAYVHVIPECPEEPGRVGNNVLVASDRDLWVPGEPLASE